MQYFTGIRLEIINISSTNNKAEAKENEIKLSALCHMTGYLPKLLILVFIGLK